MICFVGKLLILDIGCGSNPEGDINIDIVRKSGYNIQTGNQKQGDYMDVKRIKNYIVADVHHLPIKSKSIDVVQSTHVIEHVEHPVLLLKEMVRVSKRKVIVRYPHRRGSGARLPFHINYIDENWVDKNCPKNVRAEHFTSIVDSYISARMMLKLPKRFMPIIERYTPFRLLRRIERNLVWYKIYKIPFESTAWIRKTNITKSTKIIFVVVYNDVKILNSCFLSSKYVKHHNLLLINNELNEGLPTIFNRIIKEKLQDENDSWFVFCHQDFILNEDIASRLIGKDVNSIYGSIGIHPCDCKRMGQIIHRDGSLIGDKIKDIHPVQTLDEQCLIIHANIFMHGLRFDEKFKFDFYGADICMEANLQGFDVHALQLNCQHKSRPPTGSFPKSFYDTRPMFEEKWSEYFPIVTTCTIFRKEAKNT